jgi:hypothetical protein
MPRKVVFIFGPHRTGTTLLVNLLAKSPDVLTTPNDFNILRIYSYSIGKEDSDERQRQKFMEWGVKGTPIIKPYLQEKNLPISVMAPWILSPSSILRTVLTEYASNHPETEVLVHKTPRGESSLGEYKRAFAGALFIYCIRSPLPVLASRKAWKLSHGTKQWKNIDHTNRKLNIKTIKENIGYIEYCLKEMYSSFAIMDQEFKEKCTLRVVSYEDLVLNPTKVLSDIIDKLKISYDYEEIKNLSNPYTSYGGLRDRTGVYQDSLTMWKKKLSKLEVVLIHNSFKRFMKAHKFIRKDFEKLLSSYIGTGAEYLTEI